MDVFSKFNIRTKNKDLYIRAFTHTSYANENNTISYERLEYLGDSVLQLIVSEYLYSNGISTSIFILIKSEFNL